MKQKRRLTPLQVPLPAIQIHPGKGHFLRKECCWRQYGKAFLVKVSFPVRAKLALLGLGMSWHVSPSLSLSGLGILLSQRTMAQNSPILCPFFCSYSCSFLEVASYLPITRYHAPEGAILISRGGGGSWCTAGWLGT